MTTGQKVYYLALSLLSFLMAVYIQMAFPLFSGQWWLMCLLAAYAMQPLINAGRDVFGAWRRVHPRTRPSRYALIDPT